MRLKKLSISIKLLIIFILISLIPSLISAFIVSRLLVSRIENGVISRTKESLQISKKMLFANIDKVASDVQFISDMEEIRGLLRRKKILSLQHKVKIIAHSLVTPIVEVFGADGLIVARGEPSDNSIIKKVSTSSQDFHVSGGMEFEKISSVTKDDDVLIFRAAAPIVDPAFRLLGVVVISYPLDENFVDNVKRVTGTNVSVFLGDNLVATSLEDRGGRLENYPSLEQVRTVLSADKDIFLTENFSGKPYSTGYSLIRDYHGAALGVIAVALPKSHIIQMQLSSRNYILLIAFGTFIFAVLLSLIMSRGISVSLNKLLHVVRSVAKGDLSANLELQRQDEIDEVANAFNLMTRELKKSRDKLEDYNHNLEDIVDDRTKELKNAQEQLIKSAKMAAIGQLAAGIVHEINNPIGYVVNNLETLSEYNDTIFRMLAQFDLLIAEATTTKEIDVAKLAEHFEVVKKQADFLYLRDDVLTLLTETMDGVERMQTIVDNLKTFSHPGVETFKPADINKEIEKAISLVWNKLKYNCEIVKDFKSLPEISCNAGQLVQVFMNLLVNASQAINKQGKITIRTRDCGSYVSIDFCDTGKGIEKENLEKIFDPFFTTKEPGKGTGLGLSLVFDIIEKNNGTIEVSSESNKGTVFTIKLYKESFNA